MSIDFFIRLFVGNIGFGWNRAGCSRFIPCHSFFTYRLSSPLSFCISQGDPFEQEKKKVDAERKKREEEEKEKKARSRASLKEKASLWN